MNKKIIFSNIATVVLIIGIVLILIHGLVTGRPVIDKPVYELNTEEHIELTDDAKNVLLYCIANADKKIK